MSGVNHGRYHRAQVQWYQFRHRAILQLMGATGTLLNEQLRWWHQMDCVFRRGANTTPYSRWRWTGKRFTFCNTKKDLWWVMQLSDVRQPVTQYHHQWLPVSSKRWSQARRCWVLCFWSICALIKQTRFTIAHDGKGLIDWKRHTILFTDYLVRRNWHTVSGLRVFVAYTSR